MTIKQALAIREVINQDLNANLRTTTRTTARPEDYPTWSLAHVEAHPEACEGDPPGTLVLWQDLASNYTHTIYPNGETRIDS